MTEVQERRKLDIPRDHQKRPLVMNGEGTKRLAYRRVTTFIDVLEDTYHLDRWKQRMVAWGLAQSPDLILQATSATVEDKSILDEVAWNSMKRARSEAKATTGTALHKLTERIDRGETLGRVPEPHGADLRAYDAAKKRFRLEFAAIESFRVFDGWQVAGTTDRIIKFDGRYFIGDIKTGNVDWGKLKMAMQLGLYRHCKPYDIATDKRTEDPFFLEQNRALIIHLPAGQGQCTLHWVDIGLGWQACQVAKQVWDQRALKDDDIMYPVDDQLELGIVADPFASEYGYIVKAEECQTLEALKEHYLNGVAAGLDTPNFRAAVKARKAYLVNAG